MPRLLMCPRLLRISLLRSERSERSPRAWKWGAERSWRGKSILKSGLGLMCVRSKQLDDQSRYIRMRMGTRAPPLTSFACDPVRALAAPRARSPRLVAEVGRRRAAPRGTTSSAMGRPPIGPCRRLHTSQVTHNVIRSHDFQLRRLHQWGCLFWFREVLGRRRKEEHFGLIYL